MSNVPDFEMISNYRAPDESPGYLLWRVSMQWRTEIEKTLKLYDLTHPQFVVLAVIGWLSRKGVNISQIEISRAAAMDPNTISQIVRGLEKKKFIKRVQKKDARSKNPFLTPTGSAILARALPAVETADQQFFAMLSPQEAAVFVALFQKLIVRDS